MLHKRISSIVSGVRCKKSFLLYKAVWVEMLCLEVKAKTEFVASSIEVLAFY